MMTNKTPSLDFKGLAFVRALRALSNAKGSWETAKSITGSKDPVVTRFLEKAAMAGMGSNGDLIAASDPVAQEFGQYLFSMSIPGKLLASAMQLPFNVSLSAMTASGAAWVEEGKAIRLSRITSDDAKLTPCKVGGMVVVSNELLRLSTTGSDLTIRNTLVSDAVRIVDQTFLSDADSVEGVSPAGILKDAESVSGNIAALISKHVANGNNPQTSLLILPYTATWLTESEMMTLDKMGISIIYGQNAKKTIMIDASKLAINVEGTMIEPSKSGTVEMANTPTGDSLAPVGSEMVSLFQTDSSAFKAVTYCDWKKIGKPVTISA